MKTIRDINKLLKENTMYFVLENYFWKNKIRKIKKIEYDRYKDTPKSLNIWNFYLLYDDEKNGVKDISEWILYDEYKETWILFIYDRLKRLIKEWKHVFYTDRVQYATDWTANDY
jgi:hypothetical protein